MLRKCLETVSEPEPEPESEPGPEPQPEPEPEPESQSQSQSQSEWGGLDLEVVDGVDAAGEVPAAELE